MGSPFFLDHSHSSPFPPPRALPGRWWILSFFDSIFSPIYYHLFSFHVFGLGFVTSMVRDLDPDLERDPWQGSTRSNTPARWMRKMHGSPPGYAGRRDLMSDSESHLLLLPSSSSTRLAPSAGLHPGHWGLLLELAGQHAPGNRRAHHPPHAAHQEHLLGVQAGRFWCVI
jgi:hypothetical protein